MGAVASRGDWPSRKKYLHGRRRNDVEKNGKKGLGLNLARSEGLENVVDEECGNESGKLQGTMLMGSAKTFGRAAVSLGEDGRGVVHGRGRGIVNMWQAHRKSVTCAAVCGQQVQQQPSADTICEEHLVTGSRDLSLKCWNLSDANEKTPPKLVACIEDAHELCITAVATNSQGTHFASGARDGSVKVWNLDNLKERPCRAVVQGHRERNLVTSLSFLHDGSVAQGSEDLTTRIWDWSRSGMSKPSVELNSYTYFPTCMDSDASSPILVTGCKGFDGQGCGVYLWDLRKADRPVNVFSGHQQEVVGCAYLDFGGRPSILSVSKDNTAILWDARVMQEAMRAGLPFTSPCTSLSRSKDGDELFVTSLGGEYRHFRLSDFDPQVERIV